MLIISGKSGRSRGRALRSGLAAALLATASVLATGTPAHAAIPTQLPAPDSHGITSTWQQIDINNDGQPDMGQANMTTAQIMRPGSHTPTVRVRIWLPPGYQDTGTPYPVMYLLHGGDGRYSDWSDPAKGALLTQVAGTGFNGIIVMPEGGRAGWYQDWAGNTRGGFRPGWETFHTQQLVPWVDANFNTVADRSGRIVAGVSMGGYGALKYAVRRDDLFSTVAAFSGGTNIKPPDSQDTIDQSLYVFGAAVEDEGAPFDLTSPTWWDHQLPATFLEERLPLVFGPTSGWSEHNPRSRVADYQDYEGKLYLYVGTAETEMLAINRHFHNALIRDVQIDHNYCEGSGAHDWAPWRQGFKHFLQRMAGTTTNACPSDAGWQHVPGIAPDVVAEQDEWV